MRTLVACLLLMLVGAPVPAARQDSEWSPLNLTLPPEPKAGTLRWVGDLFDAQHEARLRNCAIVAVISDDQSIGFQTVRQYLYEAEEFPPYTDGFVMLAAFDGQEHDFVEREVDGQNIEWCTIFDLPCDGHRKVHANLYRNLITREFWNPMHVFLDADAVEIHRVEGHEVRFERFKEEADFAQEQLGKAMSYKDYRKLLGKVKTTLDGRQKRGHAATFRDLDKLAKKEFKTKPWKEWHAELTEKLVAEGEEMLYEAQDLLRAKDTKAASRLLKKIKREFKGHAPAEEADELLSDIDER